VSLKPLKNYSLFKDSVSKRNGSLLEVAPLKQLKAILISNQQKCYVFLISYVFSSTKLENKRTQHVLPRSGAGQDVEYVAQIMYTHVSKCKAIK
jgi:hypothetical protein